MLWGEEYTSASDLGEIETRSRDLKLRRSRSYHQQGRRSRCSHLPSTHQHSERTNEVITNALYLKIWPHLVCTGSRYGIRDGMGMQEGVNMGNRGTFSVNPVLHYSYLTIWTVQGRVFGCRKPIVASYLSGELPWSRTIMYAITCLCAREWLFLPCNHHPLMYQLSSRSSSPSHSCTSQSIRHLDTPLIHTIPPSLQQRSLGRILM